jgi:hypothetical protein
LARKQIRFCQVDGGNDGDYLAPDKAMKQGAPIITRADRK